MKHSRLLPLLLLALLFTVTSCEKDDPDVNEEELITTLTYTLSPVGGGADVVMTFRDLDGDGGDAPVITGGTLDAGVQYNGAITLLNEAESPAENITEEVEGEDLEHQFFYETSVAGLTVAYADMDADGNPTGLATTVSATTVGSGTLKVTLRHEPNKSGEGVADGNITNAGGETDIEVTFDVNVE